MIRRLFFFQILPLVALISACENGSNGDPDPKCETVEEIPDLAGWNETIVASPYIFGSAPRFQFLDDQRGYALGATLIRTMDGGGSWEEVTGFPRPPMSNLLELSVAGENNIFVLVEQFIDSNPVAERVLFRTWDGGENWESFKDFGWLISRVSFLSAEKGFALGFDLDQDEVLLLRTINGGETWDAVEGVNFGAQFSNFQITWRSAELGIAEAGGEESYVTSDGGETWTLVSNIATVPSSYFLASENTIFAHGNYSASVSDDLGQTWTAIDAASVYILSFLDQSGLALLLTPDCEEFGATRVAFATSTDGGITWTSSALVPATLASPALVWYDRQEVAPGLFVFYQPQEKTFYWFEKE